jgi:hypothetical protein
MNEFHLEKNKPELDPSIGRLSQERLAEVLALYTDPASPEYDPVFAAMIRAASSRID